MTLEEANQMHSEIEPLWRNGNLTDRKRILALSLIEERNLVLDRFHVNMNKSSFLEPAEDLEADMADDIRYLRPQKKQFAHHFSLKSILVDCFVIFLCFTAVIAVSLLRGGLGFDSVVGIDSCGVGSWSIFVGGQTLCLLCTAISFRKHGDRILGKKYQTENLRKLKSLVRWSYFGGIASGFLGIGSGLILNPVMIQLGFLPEVATSISAFSILITSAASTAQFVVQGALTVRDSAVFVVLSAIGSLIGGKLIIYLIRKFNRPSILVWIIFVMTAASALILPVLGGWRLLQTSGSFTFEGPC